MKTLNRSLETNLISLFIINSEDVSDNYVSWLNDPEVNRFLESRFQRQDIESVKKFVAICDSSQDTFLFGIRSKALGGMHVGNIKIGPIDNHHGLAEIGLLIGERAVWGKGVGTDSIKLVTQFAFNELGIRKITAGCYQSNFGSKRAFEKAGFKVEGIRERHFILNDVQEALIILGLWRNA